MKWEKLTQEMIKSVPWFTDQLQQNNVDLNVCNLIILYSSIITQEMQERGLEVLTYGQYVFKLERGILAVSKN